MPSRRVDALQMARELAAAAFDRWLDVQHRTGLHAIVGMGADGTPTTQVDQMLDDAILSRAQEIGIGVVSEESGRREGEVPLWAYVDPLDGSRNAARGIPFFCTSIAIAGGEGPAALQAAVVKDLVRSDAFEAAAGKGLLCNREPATPRAFDPEEVLVAVIADSSQDDIKREHGRRGHHLRDLGSAALELAHVAAGGLDAMIVRAPWLRSIDVAAGVLLVHEAGGVCEDAAGGPVKLGFDVRQRMSVVAAHSPQAMEAVR